MMKWELSARGIGGAFLLAGFDLANHAFEVGEYLLVHLDHPGLSLSVGDIDEGKCAAVLFAQLGQELGAGEENRARQAGVGVRAGPLQRQPAVAVGQRLGGDALAGLGPLCLCQRPLRVKRDALTFDVDLGGGLPAPADGLVGDPGVMGCHFV